MFSSNYRKKIIRGVYASLLMILFVGISACEEDDTGNIVIPVAKFEPDINFLEVTFTNTSNDAETYLWDFGVDGDLDTSTDESPSYTYSEPGTYTVILIVANSTGGADVEELEIEVREAILPEAEFTFKSTLGLEVMFNDTSLNAAAYSWDFGVDSIETDTSTMEDPSYTFPGEGEFVVSLTVTSTDGFTDTDTDTVTVSRVALIPSANINVVTTDLRISSPIMFDGTSSNAVSYAWDFGVGGVDTDVSTEQSPSFTYEEGGDYTVTLTVTSATGDTDEITENITVLLPAPVASFNSTPTDLTVAVVADASTNAGDTYSWDFGGAGSFTSGDMNTASASYTYAAGGTYTITLTVTTEDSQTIMATEEVTVIDPASTLPVAGFTFEVGDVGAVQYTDNSTNAVSWSWNFGDGSPESTDQNPEHTYATAGTYTVTLTVKNSDMDSDDISIDVIVSGPGLTGNKVAAISDTNAGGVSDTGELRLDMDDAGAGAASISVGRVTLSVLKETEATTEDGFVRLFGGSTSTSNSIVGLRLDTSSDDFEIRNQDMTVQSAIEDERFPFVEGNWIDIELIWDASSASASVAPLVTVIINGENVTGTPFSSFGASLTDIENGVETLQFALAGGSATASSRLLIDNIRIYSSDSGSEVMIFEDDFESYTVGESLDPDGPAPIVTDTPYRNNSWEAVVDDED